MIKPAYQYETRTGRRIALVLHLLWIIPAVVIYSAAKGIALGLDELLDGVGETWNK
jgi:hypothetical protein